MSRRKILLCGNYDVVVLCGTFLKKSDSISVPGYIFIGNNRSSLHRNVTRGPGGVCFLIKESLYEMFNISVFDRTKQDILWIKLKAKTSDLCFCLCVCYLPPGGSTRQCDPESFFTDLLYQYQNAGIVCISGDINSCIWK